MKEILLFYVWLRLNRLHQDKEMAEISFSFGFPFCKVSNSVNSSLVYCQSNMLDYIFKSFVLGDVYCGVITFFTISVTTVTLNLF